VNLTTVLVVETFDDYSQPDAEQLAESVQSVGYPLSELTKPAHHRKNVDQGCR
jgi:hypothetical protein